MQVFINGQPRDIAPDETLLQLIAGLDLDRRVIAVEVNSELVPREQHSEQRLQPDDRVEIVALVGGG